MARIGLCRLNSRGVTAVQNKYREGRWLNVASFCQAVGIARSTYYELIGRNRWFEQPTIQDKLRAVGIGSADLEQYYEFKDFEQDAPVFAPSAGESALMQAGAVMAGEEAREANVPPLRAGVGQGPLRETAQPAGMTLRRFHNLPRSVTAFIGREQEMAQIHTLLQAASLLTLTGAGGSGKTRLALQVAAELNETFPDGVWLVELGSLSDPALVPQAVASLFALREHVGTPLLQSLTEMLASCRLLLLLDSCEHLVPACAQLASVLLRSCPGVCLLTTSRERLGIAGEQTYRVPSLSLPDLGQTVTLENIGRYEAVRLFEDRAALSRSDFRVTRQNASVVASICRRLDGIPLALELAAARVRSLSVEDIETRLEHRFDLLTGGDRSALPRHQTLRALIDWSYDLLAPQEQLLLQRLSVFPAGWTLKAAEQVAGGAPLEEWMVLDLLTSLVDKSLVLAEEREGSVRYRMFDTLRHYALEKLHAGTDADSIFVRRRSWFRAFVEEASSALAIGIAHESWRRRLETEHDNLRATLLWSNADAEGAQEGLLLASALWRFWLVHGYGKEGLEHLRRVLGHEAAQAGTAARARALNAAGNLADNQGDDEAAKLFYLQSLAIRKEAAVYSPEPKDKYALAESFQGLGHLGVKRGDVAFAREMYGKSQEVYSELLQQFREANNRPELARALSEVGVVASQLGEISAARASLEEALRLFRELGDRRGIADALRNSGYITRREGDYVAARDFLEECLMIKNDLGDGRGVALTYHELGGIASGQRDFAAAQTFYRKGMPIFSELGDRLHVALCLEGTAQVLLAQGDTIQAVRHWGTAAALRDRIGAPVAPNMRTEYDDQLALARLSLSQDVYEIAWTEGYGLTWEQVANSAAGEGSDRS